MHINPNPRFVDRYICVKIPVNAPCWEILKLFRRECEKRGAIYNYRLTPWVEEAIPHHRLLWFGDGKEWSNDEILNKVYFSLSMNDDSRIYEYDMLSQWDEIMLELEDFVKEQAKNK